MTNKIFVRDCFDSIECHSVNSIMETCQLAIDAEANGQWKDLTVEPSLDSDSTWYIFGSRLETDKEFERRLKQISKEKEAKKKLKESKEERERREWERLKKKFGDR